MLIATLVAPYPIISAAIVRDAVTHFKCSDSRIIDNGLAADLVFAGEARPARDALLRMFDRYPIDVIVQPAASRMKQLLVADMDSTMITIECIDELADFVGKKAEVSAVTDAAMRGELDFVAALDARVALLKGLPVATLQQCYDEKVRYSAGARTLIQTVRACGGTSVLVSGGFTFFTSRVRDHLGFASDHANILNVDKDVLTGTVSRPIVTAEVKRATLQAQASALGLTLDQCIAIGDGANDIPMIEAAGLGIAYRAKPKTEAAADASLRHSDLTALLYAMGIPRTNWVTA
jgi:phosphoserine phosphatase